MPDQPDLEMGKTFTALVRIHEANCQLDFLSDEEANFRLAIMKKLGTALKLSEVRHLTITGPGKPVARPASRS